MDNQHRIQWMHEQLNTQLNPSELTIVDESHKHVGHPGAKDGAGHFSIEICAKTFQGKSLLECHRMVYSVLAKAIPHEIHALRIKIL